MKKSSDKKKIIANNKRAAHDYFIIKTLEAGIVLKGTEVKSIRQGRVNLKESYVIIKNAEVYILGMHISPYDHGNIFNSDPLRTRKLLLNKTEIRKWGQEVKLNSYTIVPLNLYLSKGRVKIEIALCKGKKLYDVRESEMKKESERRLERKYKL